MEESSKKESKKGTFLKVGKYLREISVVVIGVAITFIVSDWISGRNEKKDLKRYLDAIQLELKENLASMKVDAKEYRLTIEFGNYLSSTKRENIQADSISKYFPVIGYLYTATYDTSAFEMLKSSGAMRLIKDDLLLSSILKCYILMNEATTARDKYLQRKQDELFSAVLNGSLDLNNPDLFDPKNARMLNFYSIPIDVEEPFLDCIKQIEKTLAMFK